MPAVRDDGADNGYGGQEACSSDDYRLQAHAIECFPAQRLRRCCGKWAMSVAVFCGLLSCGMRAECHGFTRVRVL